MGLIDGKENGLLIRMYDVPHHFQLINPLITKLASTLKSTKFEKCASVRKLNIITEDNITTLVEA